MTPPDAKADKNGWMPIETAPKGGVVIIACDTVNEYASLVAFRCGEWECIGYNASPMSIGFYPDYWMPLPPIPVATVH